MTVCLRGYINSSIWKLILEELRNVILEVVSRYTDVSSNFDICYLCSKATKLLSFLMEREKGDEFY